MIYENFTSYFQMISNIEKHDNNIQINYHKNSHYTLLKKIHNPKCIHKTNSFSMGLQIKQDKSFIKIFTIKQIFINN